MDKVRILLFDHEVGALTEEGDIITNNVCLQKIAARIKGKKLGDMRNRRDKSGGLFFTGTKVGKGDDDYYSIVVELLHDEGYRLQRTTTP